MNKQSSLARDFTFFSAFILITVTIACLLISSYTHYSYFYKEKDKVIYEGSLIQNRLDDILASVENYISFVGNKIAKNENANPQIIKELFSSSSYHNLDGSPEWTVFSWITPDNKILESSAWGNWYEKDLKLLNREYLEKTQKYPGKLLFGTPDIGLVSKQEILPAGVGIVDSNKKFLGTIGVGLGITRLGNDLQGILKSEELVFVLLNDKFQPILFSNDLTKKEINFLFNLNEVKNTINMVKTQTQGFIEKDIESNKFSFNYFIKSQKYPIYILMGKNLQKVSKQYWYSILPRIAELLILAIVFIIILHYFRAQIVKPILFMSKMAKKIADGEKVSLKPATYEEFNYLIDQLSEIQEAKDLLVKSKVDTEKENLTLEKKIKERTADLENALSVKTDFLNRVSHEVRTPVHGITTISEGLVEHWNEHSEEKRLKLASAVAVNSKRLFSLVSNILDLATFNSGKMVFNFKNENIIALIEDIIEECRSLYITNKNINISFIEHPKELFINIDLEKIGQVLRNLITNSIKFMLSGEISISLNVKGDFCLISVKDQGVGAPENELNKIFEPFIQSTSTIGRYSGAGLGLSICQKIIEKHNGKIWAENNLLQGLTMNIKIPCFIKNNCIPDITKKENSSELLSILMVDDESACQMSMDLLLSGTNTHLISMYGGVSALEYLRDKANKVDLIFLDLMMPDMYGLDVLEAIKKDDNLKDIPVIIQSGTNDNLVIEKSLNSGALAFIRKPYQRQQILNLIDEFSLGKGKSVA